MSTNPTPAVDPVARATRGTPLSGCDAADLTMINQSVRAHVCPVHDAPLTVTGDQWECPHGDVVMTLDDLDIASSGHNIDLCLHEWETSGQGLHPWLPNGAPMWLIRVSAVLRALTVLTWLGTVLYYLTHGWRITVANSLPLITVIAVSMGVDAVLGWRRLVLARTHGRGTLPDCFRWEADVSAFPDGVAAATHNGYGMLVRAREFPGQAGWVAPSMRDVILAACREHDNTRRDRCE